MCFLAMVLPNQMKRIRCFLASSLVLSVAIASTEIAKPGCPDECGGVKIPFPFGIGDGCYLNNNALIFPTNGTYQIKCDNTTNPPVPFLYGNNINTKVVSINHSDHTIHISSGVAYQCYRNGLPLPSTEVNSTYNLPNLVPFNISATRNTFVAIGCDTTGQVTDWQDDTTGCTTSCGSSSGLVRNGACSGHGCCQTSIYNTLIQPVISVGSVSNYSNLWNDMGDRIRCSYAFVGEVGSYQFTVSNLTATAKDCDKIRVPVVYDWSVLLSINCSEAKRARNGAMICGSNTRCVDGTPMVGLDTVASVWQGTPVIHTSHRVVKIQTNASMRG